MSLSMMDVVPTCSPGTSPPPSYYHIIKSQANSNNINNKRGASTKRVPPLTAFSGGLSKNMDLHSQYERLALVGQRSHSALFGSSSSVWRLPTHSSFFSSSASDVFIDTLPVGANSYTSPGFATATQTATQQQASSSHHHHHHHHHHYRGGEFQAQDAEEQTSSKLEFPCAAASDDDDNDDEDYQEEDDTRDSSLEPRPQPRNYQYKHIFSNSVSAPASTYHPPHFLQFSFNVMTGPDRTSHASPSSSSVSPSSHRANPLAAPNQPPRPPNAWILYRSDKLKNIPSPPPGAPKRPQAEVSKMISQMWKLESADVRGHYERLSEIKKAEHQAMYPGYRFQPMKKEDKDRLRAEKQAEKEREREARKASKKTRHITSGLPVTPGAEMPPLFTTQARPLPSSSTSVPTQLAFDGSSISQPHSIGSTAPSSSGPPGDLPTPPNDSDNCTPPSIGLPSQPQPQPLPSPSSSFATVPPLLAPQPIVPQCPPSPSAWEDHRFATSSTAMPPSTSSSLLSHQQQDTPFSLDSIPTWFDSSMFLPDPPSDADGYITVPLPSQQPLGWSPDDPGPLSDMHLSFFNPPPSSSQHPTLSIKTNGLASNIPTELTQSQTQSNPPSVMATASTSTAPTTVSPDQLQLHAVVAATNDPNIFALDFNFLNNELFDGTREIQVSVNPNMSSSTFGDFIANNENDDFANFFNWDPSNFSAAATGNNNGMNYPYPSSYSTRNVDYSIPLGLGLGLDVDMGGMDSLNASEMGILSSSTANIGDNNIGARTSGMGVNESSSLPSTSMITTPSTTSANTSQTSLHPTPPPPWSTGRSEREEGDEEEERLNSSNAQSDFAHQHQQQQQVMVAATPYVPPAGAIHSSTRRVAGDWRRIRIMTPEPEYDLQVVDSRT